MRHRLAGPAVCGRTGAVPDSTLMLLGAADESQEEPMRSPLRERFRSSPICDGPGFARDLGDAYRRA